MLGDCGDLADREAGQKHHDRTADDNEDTGAVAEVFQLADCEEAVLAALHHTYDHDQEGSDNTNNISNIHRKYSHPFSPRMGDLVV